jgi:hypothetical protein
MRTAAIPVTVAAFVPGGSEGIGTVDKRVLIESKAAEGK